MSSFSVCRVSLSGFVTIRRQPIYPMTAVRGRDSESAWAPSLLTRPAERAARTQNQA
jgi:hypothetical protein